MTTTERVEGAAAVATEREALLDQLRGAFAELLGAERRLRGRDQHRRAGGELSHHQIRALFHLEKEPEVTAGCLAKNAELSPASMTAMLDQLEEWGFVTRRRSAEDRRQVLVALTDEGRAKLDRKRAAWNETFLAALGEHSDEELAAAVRVMRTVGGFLDTLGRD
jgi:MarR family transcriptional regulator, organic hydroperoxide resistance regulator